MDIDVSLDDVIAKKKTRTGRGRGRGGRGARGNGGVTRSTSDRSTVREKYSGAVPSQTKSPLSGLPVDGSKIVVSNLPEDVTENQIRELFDSTVGRIKKVSLAFKSDGKSAGVATLEFVKPGDGSKAFAAYNGRLIDQKRPMKVEIIVDPSKIPPPPLASRVAPAKVEAAQAAQASTSTYAFALAAPTGSPEALRNSGEPSSSKRGRGGRGRGRRGRGKDSRPAVTAEELDQEMEQYAKGGES